MIRKRFCLLYGSAHHRGQKVKLLRRPSLWYTDRSEGLPEGNRPDYLPGLFYILGRDAAHYDVLFNTLGALTMAAGRLHSLPLIVTIRCAGGLLV